MPNTANSCFGRDVVSPRAFPRHASDLMGTGEQYARKYHALLHRTLGLVLSLESAKCPYAPVAPLWHSLRTLPRLCHVGERTSSYFSSDHPSRSPAQWIAQNTKSAYHKLCAHD